MKESKLQTDIISWLKINQAYVIKTRPGPGTPVGCPDIIALYEDRWVAIEVKADEKSPFQPGQKLTLQKLKAWCPLTYVVYPDNWPQVKEELIALLF